MADNLKSSRVFTQVAFESDVDNLKSSRVFTQVAFESSIDNLKSSRVFVQIAFSPPETVTQEQLMRHGKYFGSGVERPMKWAR